MREPSCLAELKDSTSGLIRNAAGAELYEEVRERLQPREVAGTTGEWRFLSARRPSMPNARSDPDHLTRKSEIEPYDGVEWSPKQGIEPSVQRHVDARDHQVKPGLVPTGQMGEQGTIEREQHPTMQQQNLQRTFAEELEGSARQRGGEHSRQPVQEEEASTM